MGKIKLTDEQRNGFYHVEKTNYNLIIKAFAGSGKTFFLTNACKLLNKNLAITFLAFNRHIKEELAEKLPDYMRVNTSHGAGLAALKRAYPNIEMDEFKVDKIIRKKSKKWGLNKIFGNYYEIEQYQKELKKIVNLCRSTLTLDKKYVSFLAEKHEIKLKDTDIKRVSSVMEELMLDRKTFDFTDMVFLPAIDKKIWFFPQDIVLVDEFQDLSKAQQRIIEKMLKKDRVTKKVVGRLILCGDEKQLIYGFNGVSIKNLEWFESFGEVKTLPLSYTFRCAKNIVKEAQKIVPEIKALPDAPDGVVRDGSVLDEANDGDFVLCRTTEPLVRLFFELLERGKTAYIKGSDIGIEIKNMCEGFDNLGVLKNYWEKKINELKANILNSGVLNAEEDSGYVALNDKINVINFLARFSETVDDLLEKLHLLFGDNNKEGIILSTVHKSKGLEADRVFIVKPELLPMKVSKGWQYAQELNLQYVAITRARLELIYDKEWDRTDE